MQDLVELGVPMAAEELIERKDRFLVGKARERNSYRILRRGELFFWHQDSGAFLGGRE